MGEPTRNQKLLSVRANLDNLIDSAGLAAEVASHDSHGGIGLCLLVSDLGRCRVIEQMIEDELDIVQEKLDAQFLLPDYIRMTNWLRSVMSCSVNSTTKQLL